jgi:hypothetical protein
VPVRLPASGYGPYPTLIHEFVLTTFFSRGQWEVTRTPRGTYTITNRGISLSFEGEPKLFKAVEGISDVREWSLYKAADPFSYQ